MASITTNYLRKQLLTAGIDIENDSGVKAMLLSTAYTPNKDHDFVDDINANELSGTGYAGGFAGSGRKTLASRAIVQDDSGDVSYADCADITWTAINAGTIGHIAIIKEITNDAASVIIAIIDTADVTTDGGNYTWQVAADGFLKLS